MYYDNDLLSDLLEVVIFSRNVKVKGNNQEQIQLSSIYNPGD